MTYRLLLGIIIVVFCSACGFMLAKKYRKRKQFFTQLYQFNERFLNEIAYYRRPIEAFTSQHEYKGEFALLLTLYLEGVKTDDEAFDVRNNAEFTFLTEEEKNGVNDYFRMLGKGDSLSQKGYFTAKKESLCAWQNEANAIAKKYGDLYVKLGFLFGLFLLIVLI